MILNSKYDIPFILDSFEKLHVDKTKITLSGRIISLREFKTKSFINISYNFNTIQCLVDNSFLTSIECGDIIKLEGYAVYTNTKDKAIEVTRLSLMSKNYDENRLYHSKNILVNDVIMNKVPYKLIKQNDFHKTIKIRFYFLKYLKELIELKEYIHVDIPIIQKHYGGALAKPFITRLNSTQEDYFLNISLELNLKELLIGGFEKVYSVGKVFRNEGIDRTHNPEFTLLELYCMNKALPSLIKDILKIINKTFDKVNNKMNLGLTYPFKNIKIYEYKELIKSYLNINVNNKKEIAMKISELNLIDEELDEIKMERHCKYCCILIDYVVKKLCEKDVLIIISDFPKVTKLAKDKNKLTIHKTEGYYNGVEILNAYDEQNDFSQIKESSYDFPITFIDSMRMGLNQCSGIGIGLDRLMCILFNLNFYDVLIWPL